MVDTSKGNQTQRDAFATLQQTLNTYGLGALAHWAWNEIVNGASNSQVLLDMYQQQPFKDRFGAIFDRQAKGLPALSPADVINYEAKASELMKAAGIPAGFWDSPSDFRKLLANDVGIDELGQRIDLAVTAAYQMPKEVRDVYARDYGLGPGDWAANFLDPTQAEPLLKKRLMAAQIGGTALTTGYGATTRAQDERLAELGVTGGQAQQGFSTLAQSHELFGSLPGENTTGISQEDQFAAAFGGNAEAQQAIQKRAQQRQAAFGGGGGFSTSQEGFTGLGNASGG